MVDADGAVLGLGGDGAEVVAATVPCEVLDCVFDCDLEVGAGDERAGPFCGGFLCRGGNGS